MQSQSEFFPLRPGLLAKGVVALLVEDPCDARDNLLILMRHPKSRCSSSMLVETRHDIYTVQPDHNVRWGAAGRLISGFRSRTELRASWKHRIQSFPTGNGHDLLVRRHNLGTYQELLCEQVLNPALATEKVLHCEKITGYYVFHPMF